MPSSKNRQLSKNPSNNQARSTTITTARTEISSYEGPIPHPYILTQYNDIIPNGADRILAMAENQSAHRIQLEKAVVNSDILRAYLGLGSGFIVALTFLICSFILILNNQAFAGTVLGSIDLLALVSLFVYGTNERKKERSDKVNGSRKT